MTNRFALTRTDIVLLVLAAGMVALYVIVSGGGFPLDDSWIHQTYGRNLGTTGVWAFIPGQQSAASSSPLYTVLLAAGYALGLPYTLWTHGLGALALGLTGITGAWLARHLAPRHPRLPFIVGLALVLNWHLIWAAAAGMETALFSLWTLVIAVLAFRNASSRDHLTMSAGASFGIVAALATLTRPEGLLLAGIGGLAVVAACWRQPKRLLVWAVAAGLGFGVLIAPYALYNHTVTGGLLPDTAAAKQAEYAPLLALSYPERFGRMLYPLAAGVLPLLVPGIAYYVFTWLTSLSRLKSSGPQGFRPTELYTRQVPLSPERERSKGEGLAITFASLLPILWAVALVILYAARLPANYQHGRYVIPAIPGFLLAGVIGTAWLLDQSRRSPVVRVMTRVLALAALVVVLLFSFVLGPSAYRQDVRLVEEEMVASARWIETNIPPDELLAVHDIGAVGYFAPRPILDLAGLVTPEVVPLMGNPDALWGFMRERDARYLMAFPDQIPGQDATDTRLCPLFATGSPTARGLGRPNMAIYRLAWDERCQE